MGQISGRRHGRSFLKEVLIKPAPDFELTVTGTHNPGEDDVGYAESFEISEAVITKGDVMNVIAWAEAHEGGALTEIERLCIEQVNDET